MFKPGTRVKLRYTKIPGKIIKITPTHLTITWDTGGKFCYERVYIEKKLVLESK